jgi:hypothetical protein
MARKRSIYWRDGPGVVAAGPPRQRLLLARSRIE